MMKYDENTVTRLIRAIGFAASVAVVMTTGCNFFEPREADPPSTSDNVPYVPPNGAAGVFANLTSGIENMAQGANYERSLADNFNFIPYEQDAIDLPGAFADWSKDVEMNVLKLMLSENDDAEVTFNRTVNIDETDYVQFRVTYELSFVSKSDGTQAVYKGIAEFDVRRNAGIWEVELWREVEKVESFTTWGYLKGTLRQRLEH
jgi:hypothetical protein